MKVIVTGGAGFIGAELIARLIARGHQVVVLNHRPPVQPSVEYHHVDLGGEELLLRLIEGADGIIHLAGQNIFGRWSESVKKAIYDSRILSTRSLVSTIGKLDRRPSVLISASAVGIYGDRGEEELTESSAPGNDFLARVCLDWESESRKAESLGVRTVQVRTAPVLGRGGLLKKILPVFRIGFGGRLGSGRQWFPWVHMQDIVGVYVQALEDQNLSGPFNACSPNQVRNVEFTKTLGAVLHRPTIVPAPQWGLRIVFNGLADAILSSQKVQPKRLIESNYKFQMPDLRQALEEVLRRK